MMTVIVALNLCSQILLLDLQPLAHEIMSPIIRVSDLRGESCAIFTRKNIAFSIFSSSSSSEEEDCEMERDRGMLDRVDTADIGAA